MIIDSKDMRIVEELRKDSSISVRDLARKVGMNKSTIHDRIKRLQKEGVIERFTVKLDNKAVGEGFIALVFLTAREFDKGILKDRKVKEVYRISGEFEIMLKIKCKDINEFNQFVLELKKKIIVEKFSSVIVTDVVREGG